MTHKEVMTLRPGKSGTDVSWFKFKFLKLKQSTEHFVLVKNVISELPKVHLNHSMGLNSVNWVIKGRYKKFTKKVKQQ